MLLFFPFSWAHGIVALWKNRLAESAPVDEILWKVSRFDALPNPDHIQRPSMPTAVLPHVFFNAAPFEQVRATPVAVDAKGDFFLTPFVSF